MKKILKSSLIACFSFFAACDNGTAQELLDAKAFEQKIAQDKNPTIIDVRSPEEFESGHLENAQNINWNGSNFDQAVSKFNKNKPVYVYCLSGGRSADAAAKMRQDGFKTVYELQGGMLKWRAAKLPESHDAKTTTAHKGMTREAYNTLVQADEYVLVDFHAEWCKPCKKMKPFLDEIAQELGSKVRIERIDIDDNPSLANELSVDAIPAVLIYKKGVMMWYHIGYVGKEELLKHLK